MKIQLPATFPLNLFFFPSSDMWGCMPCFYAAIWVWVERRKEILEKLGHCHRFLRWSNPLSTVGVFLIALPAVQANGYACNIHGQWNQDVVYCSELPHTRETAVPMKTHLFSFEVHESLCITPRFLSRTFWTGMQASCPKQKEKNIIFIYSAKLRKLHSMKSIV